MNSNRLAPALDSALDSALDPDSVLNRASWSRRTWLQTALAAGVRATATFPAAISMTAVTSLPLSARAANTTLLNVSYDVSREFYKEFNTAFVAHWKKTTGEDLTINQSHGGSSRQARSVIDGLEADMITMNQSNDIDILYERAKMVPQDWAKRLPNNSAPTTSLSIILVRRGNPKNIRDWSDLGRPGVSVIIPNPKTSGNGR